MRSRREDLEESRDFWQESAEHDRHQAVLSIAVVGAGSAAAGVGAVATFEGHPIVGVPAILVGASMVIAGIKDARKEIQSAMEIHGKVAVHQHEINRIDSEQPEPDSAA